MSVVQHYMAGDGQKNEGVLTLSDGNFRTNDNGRQEYGVLGH